MCWASLGHSLEMAFEKLYTAMPCSPPRGARQGLVRGDFDVVLNGVCFVAFASAKRTACIGTIAPARGDPPNMRGIHERSALSTATPMWIIWL